MTDYESTGTEDKDAALSNGVANGAGTVPELDAEALQKILQLRSHLQESVGKIVLTLMGLPRYRHQTLADLSHLVIDPLMRDRIAIAQKSTTEPGTDLAGPDMAGLAIWANVSDEVDAKIREQIKAGVWPLRLKAEDWTSGDTNWLIDVIAPNPKATANVIANLGQVITKGGVHLHPLVKRGLDDETLAKLSAGKATST